MKNIYLVVAYIWFLLFFFVLSQHAVNAETVGWIQQKDINESAEEVGEQWRAKMPIPLVDDRGKLLQTIPSGSTFWILDTRKEFKSSGTILRYRGVRIGEGSKPQSDASIVLEEVDVRDSKSIQMRLPIGHADSVTGAVFLTNRHVVTASLDASLILWDLNTGIPLRQTFLPAGCNAIERIDAAGNAVLNCGIPRREVVRAVVNPWSGKIRTENDGVNFMEAKPDVALIRGLRLNGVVASCAMAPDGDTCLVGYKSGDAEVWSLKLKERILTLQSQILPVQSVKAAGDVVATWRFRGHRSERFDDHHLQFWKPSKLTVVKAEAGKSRDLISGILMRGGKRFVSCEDAGFDNQWNLVVRDVDTGRILSRKASPKPLPSILSGSLSGNGFSQVYYGLTGPGVHLWKLTDHDEVELVHSHPDIGAGVAAWDDVGNRLFAREFVVEGEGLVKQYNPGKGGETGVLGKGHPEVYGTAVGLQFAGKNGPLLLSNFHRSNGFATSIPLDGRGIRTWKLSGLHTFTGRPRSSQVVLAGTEGSTTVTAADVGTGNMLGSWETTQNSEFHEQQVAAYGWTNRMDKVAVSGDGARAYVALPSGVVQVLKINPSGTKIEVAGMLVPLTEGDWALLDGENHYACSPGAAAKMSFVRNGNGYSFDALNLQFNRPDLVAEVLGGSRDFVNQLSKACEDRRRKLSGTGNASNLPETVIRLDPEGTAPRATADSAIAVTVKPIAPGRAIDKILVYVNGCLDSTVAPPDGIGDAMKLNVRLTPGPNQIEVVAESKGQRSLPEAMSILSRPEKWSKPNLYFLSIGVSDYKEDGLDLKSAAKDARDMAEFFAQQKGKAYGEVSTKILIDQQANREGILGAREYFGQAGEGDVVILFLAGHGLLDADGYRYFFGTPDIDLGNPASRGVSYDEIAGLLSQSRARSRLLVMDTCYAGEVETFDLLAAAPQNEGKGGAVKARAIALETPRRKAESTAFLREQMFSDVGRSSGATVVTGSGGMEFVFALESEAVGNGLFTHCILKSLSGGGSDLDGNGYTTVKEAFVDVGRELLELSQGAQKPFLREMNRFSNFDISQCRPYPKINARAIITSLHVTECTNGDLSRLSGNFTNNCDYYGRRMTRGGIIDTLKSDQQQFDLREIQVTSDPLLEYLDDGRAKLTYQRTCARVNSKIEPSVSVARYGAKRMLRQDLELILRYSAEGWLIESIQALSAQEMPNPMHREH